MDGVLFTPLRRIHTPNGDVLHGMKAEDPGFAGFGEAYFSEVHAGAVKGWKRHRAMTLNLVGVGGRVLVAVHNDQTGKRAQYLLGPDDAETHARLTISPMLWVAFGGAGEARNVLLNVASLKHDPTEADTVALDTFPWSWDAS